MIKYKVKARLAKNMGTDDFSLEEFEQVFENDKSPIKARKKAYNYYQSIIDIINDKKSDEEDHEIISKHIIKSEFPKGIDILEHLNKMASYKTGVGIYVMSDSNEELFEAGEENLIIGYNNSFDYLQVTANLEEEMAIYKAKKWDTEDWTTKIKYWDYEGEEGYDDIFEEHVLFTTFNFWEYWNPDLAKEEVALEEKEEDNVLSQIIDSGENRNLEFKSSLRYCYRQKSAQKYIEDEIVKTILAFANTEGGTLLVGVDDDGEVLGLNNDFLTFKGNTKDKFLKHFANIIGSRFTEPIDAIIKYGIERSNNLNIFLVIVEKSSKPRFIKSNNGEMEFYIRRSATSQKLNIEEAVKYVIDKWHSN